MYQKNELKNLIYIQENKPCNEQTVKGLFRSIVEPILDKNGEAFIFCRLEEKSQQDFDGILKRLSYSNAKLYDFSDKPIPGNFENVLKEKIWDKTEFIFVSAERFGAALIFDYEESDLDGFAQIYLLYNSKKLSESFEVINSNSVTDLSKYQSRFRSDRRDNLILNASIRRIVENLNETNQEILISQLEKEDQEENIDAKARLDFIANKSSYVSHEIRNQLSICNLYSNIIEKQLSRMKFDTQEVEKSITNAVEYIQKSIKMAGNMLLDLKCLKNTELEEYDLGTMIESAIGFTQVYSNGKDIQFKKVLPESVSIMVDENKFLAVLINLIKNAVESIEEKGEIVISAKEEPENVKITISNTGSAIKKEIQEKIFENGFTTKSTGSGLGLVICKKTLEEQYAQLKLKKSDETSTEFEITVLKG